MSLSDEFQVTLVSNVTCNPRNSPAQFETQLAKPLDLPGEWEVALIDMSYPHNWTNLDKSYYLMLLTPLAENEHLKPITIVDNEIQNIEIEKALRIRTALPIFNSGAILSSKQEITLRANL